MIGGVYEIAAKMVLTGDQEFMSKMDTMIGAYNTAIDQNRVKSEQLAHSMDMVMTAAVVAAGGAFTAAALAAVKFETDTTNIATVVGGQNDAFKAIKEGLLDMALKVPTSLTALSGAMYEIVSAAVPAEHALNVLETSAKAAIGGVADTTDVFNLFNLVIKGYGMEWGEVNRVSDIVFQTVQLGNTNVSELSSSLGAMVPLASNLGINLETLGGAMATLPGVTGSTSEAAIQLESIMTALIKPTGDMEGLFKALGVASGAELVEKMGGLSGALDAIKQYTAGGNVAIGDLLGRKEALIAFFALTGNQAGDFKDKIEAMSNATGAAAAAYELQIATFENQSTLFKNAIQEGLITSGQRFLDLLTPLLTEINKHPEAVAKITVAIGDLILIIGGAAGIIITVTKLQTAFSALSLFLASNPFAVAVLALGAVAAAVVMMADMLPPATNATKEFIDSLGAQNEKLQELTQKYTELTTKAGLTTAEQKILENITRVLKDQFGLEAASIKSVNDLMESNTLQTYIQTQTALKAKIDEVTAASGSELTQMMLGGYGAGDAQVRHENLRKELELLETEYAANEKSLTSFKDAQAILNAQSPTTVQGYAEQIAKVQSLITENEGNAVIVSQLKSKNAELNTEMDSLTKKVNEQSTAVNSLSEAQKILKDAGGQTTQAIKDQILEISNAIPFFENDKIATEKLKDEVAALYLKLGDDAGWLKLTTGLDATALAATPASTAFTVLRSAGKGYYEDMLLLNPELQKTVDKFNAWNLLTPWQTQYQNELTTAGVELRDTVNEQITGYSALIPKAQALGDAYSESQLLGKVKALYDKVGDTAGWEAFLKESGASEEAIRLLGDQAVTSKNKFGDYIDEVGNLATKFLGLGSTGSQAVGLLTSTMGSLAKAGVNPLKDGFGALLKGGIDPVSLGMKAAGLIFDIFGKKHEPVVRSLEQVKASLGETYVSVEKFNKLFSSLGFESSFVGEIQKNIDYYLEHLRTATGSVRQYYEDMVASSEEMLARILAAFNVSAEFQKATDDFDTLIAKMADLRKNFGNIDLSGLLPILQEMIIKMIDLQTTIDPNSMAAQELALKLQAARQQLVAFGDNNALMYLHGLAAKFELLLLTIPKGTAQFDAMREQVILTYQALFQATKGAGEFVTMNQETYQKLLDAGQSVGAMRQRLTELGFTQEEINKIFADANNIYNQNTGTTQTLVEQIRAAMTSMGGLTVELIDALEKSRNGMDDLTEQALDLRQHYGNIKFPQMTADLQAAIANNQALLATLDPTSAAYLEMQDSITKAQYALAVMNGYQGDLAAWLIANNLHLNNAATAANTVTLAMEKLSIVLEERFQNTSDSLTNFNANLKTIEETIKTLANLNINLNTTTADEQIKAMISQMMGFLNTLNPNSPAYKTAYDQLKNLTEEFLKIGGKVEPEILLKFKGDWQTELTNVQATIGNLRQQKIDLAAQFVVNQRELQAKLATVDASIAELTRRSIDIDIQFSSDKIAITDKFNEIRDSMRDIMSREYTPTSLIEMNRLLEEINGQSMKFKNIWDPKSATTFKDWEDFFGDINKSFDTSKLGDPDKWLTSTWKTAMENLRNISKFNIDLDTTDMDEQVNALIYKMKSYIATLDPSSSAAKTASQYLDALIGQFKAIGGTLDENAAKSFVGEEAKTAQDALLKQLEELQKKYDENKLNIQFDMNKFTAQRLEIEGQLTALKEKFEQDKLKIDVDLTAAYARLNQLMAWLAQIGTGQNPPPPTLHKGGFGYDVVAHKGMVAQDEVVALLKKNEVVIPENIVSQFSSQLWRKFIQTGDPNIFFSEGKGTGGATIPSDLLQQIATLQEVIAALQEEKVVIDLKFNQDRTAIESQLSQIKDMIKAKSQELIALDFKFNTEQKNLEGNLANLNNLIGSKSRDLIMLEYKFNQDQSKLDSQLKNIQTMIQSKSKELVAFDIKFNIEQRTAQTQIDQIRQMFTQLWDRTPGSLVSMDKLLEKITGVPFGEYGDFFAKFEAMITKPFDLSNIGQSGLASAFADLQKMIDSGIYDADKLGGVNNLIIKMQDYLATMGTSDPNRANVQAWLDQLMAKFEEAGGELLPDKAWEDYYMAGKDTIAKLTEYVKSLANERLKIELDLTQLQNQKDLLQNQLVELQKVYDENRMTLLLDLQSLETQKNQVQVQLVELQKIYDAQKMKLQIDLDMLNTQKGEVEKQLDALITKYNRDKITIGFNLETATSQLAALMALLGQYTPGTYHSGGLVRAHTGYYASNEVPALLLDREFVMNQGATDRFDVASLERYNMTKNPSDLRLKDGRGLNSANVSFQVQVFHANPETTVKINKVIEPYLRARERNRQEVNIFN